MIFKPFIALIHITKPFRHFDYFFKEDGRFTYLGISETSPRVSKLEFTFFPHIFFCMSKIKQHRLVFVCYPLLMLALLLNMTKFRFQLLNPNTTINMILY